MNAKEIVKLCDAAEWRPGRSEVDIQQGYEAGGKLLAFGFARPPRGPDAYEDGSAEYTRARRYAALLEALEFYADPESYVAIGFFPDPPCGAFADDVSDTGEQWGHRPGKKARAVLEVKA